MPAGEFLFGKGAGVEDEVLWGDSMMPLWLRGEPLVVVGREGVGKSTLVQRLVLALLGFDNSGLLGLPVNPVIRRALYFVADRPAQFRRSLIRMVEPSQSDELSNRLLLSVGPPPFDLVVAPESFRDVARSVEADMVVVDSLKDFVPDVSRDEVGYAINRAAQLMAADSIETLFVHHERKDRRGGGAPTIADLHGSRWIAAGAGSVIALDGRPGAAAITLRHLKPPKEPVGPIALRHLKLGGQIVVADSSKRGGSMPPTAPVTAKLYAEQIGLDPGVRADVERARRTLDQYVSEGLLVREPSREGSASIYAPCPENER